MDRASRDYIGDTLLPLHYHTWCPDSSDRMYDHNQPVVSADAHHLSYTLPCTWDKPTLRLYSRETLELKIKWHKKKASVTPHPEWDNPFSKLTNKNYSNFIKCALIRTEWCQIISDYLSLLVSLYLLLQLLPSRYQQCLCTLCPYCSSIWEGRCCISWTRGSERRKYLQGKQ